MHPLKFTLLMFISLFMLVGCFSEGPRVMIETEQPESDFVVVCSWSSHFFGIHGGKSRVKEKVFVTFSGRVVDCGMSVFGHSSRAEIWHPLYRHSIGGENEQGFKSVRGYQKDDVYVFTPQSKLAYLEGLIDKYEGNDLKRAVVGLGGIDSYYSYYSSVKERDKDEFRKKYKDRLTIFWDKLLPILYKDWVRSYSNPDELTVENIVENRM